MTYIFANIFEPVIPIETIYGTIDRSVAIASLIVPAFSPLFTFLDLSSYYNYKNSLNEEKGIENEINYVKQELKNNKDILLELKNKQKMVQERSDFKVTKIDNLTELKDYLEILYDLGFNEDRYLRYFQKGNIDRLLQEIMMNKLKLLTYI